MIPARLRPPANLGIEELPLDAARSTRVTSTTILEGLGDPANRTIWREYVDRYRPLILGYAARKGFAQDRDEHIPGLFCVASAIVLDGAPIGEIVVTGRALDPLLDRVNLIQHTAEVI